LTTKIHVLADALGRPLRFILTGGEAHDITTAPELLADLSAGGVIADKAYDSNALRDLHRQSRRAGGHPFQSLPQSRHSA
jgi:transposase